MTPETAARRARVEELTRQGMSARQIADILGCTDRTVVRHRRILGIAQERHPYLTEAMLERAAELVKDGCPHKEIARTVGCSQHSITRHFPGTQWTKEQAAEYISVTRRSA